MDEMMLKRGLFLFVSALPAVAFAAATLTMLTVMTRGTALFSFHPIFMAAAFCLCMPATR
ncbi:hypothetical protein T484DRAFT_1786853 [Baffinella frigidus]|nr:hypothetical protein T484DRAFT_1786853 [Cryptophyta sp. CCMP2293]